MSLFVDFVGLNSLVKSTFETGSFDNVLSISLANNVKSQLVMTFTGGAIVQDNTIVIDDGGLGGGVGAVTFTFKNSPSGDTEVLIAGGGTSATLSNLRAKISAFANLNVDTAATDDSLTITNKFAGTSPVPATLNLPSLTATVVSNAGTGLENHLLSSAGSLHRNGPYGHPTFRQIRVHQNPLSRYQVANNVFSFVEVPSREVLRTFGDNQIEYVNSRYGIIRTFDEVPLSSKYYPIQFLFGVGVDNDRIQNKDDLSIPNVERIIINDSFGNEIGHFANDDINKYYNLSSETEEDYEKIKEFYLNGGLDADDSPITTFEFLKYKETIFPREINTYKSHVRQRTNYLNNFWRDIRSDRSEVTSNNFGTTLSQSIWPLDATSDWATRDKIRVGKTNGTGSDPGILQNNYSLVSDNLSVATPANINAALVTAPYYTRRHTIDATSSVASPSGIEIEETSSALGPLFQGTALWEAGIQAGKNPFYASYDLFFEQLRGKGKDFSVVPEFRISDHVATLLSRGANTKILDFFEVTGGLSSSNQSSETSFYETYSTTDFLKHFAKIKKDHEDFVEPSAIRLTCKGLKKFLAYDSFYPAIRTKEMAEQFFDSYGNFVQVSSFKGAKGASSPSVQFMNLLTPLYAPGVLFNSIKAGVACDYPLIIDKDQPDPLEIEGNFYIGSGSSGEIDIFDFRVPFEAIVEPEKHLANIELFSNVAHPSGNISGSAFWDGSGDLIYKKMASNFCAETSEFFLKDSSFTSLASLKQSDPNFGVATAGERYRMRVKMYRSMDGPTQIFSGSDGPFRTPQDYLSASFAGRPIPNSRETITMYSRPSAFGPPVMALNSDGTKTHGSEYGFNFPFTPPYYHGQAWADIEFVATETKKYTVSEILGSSSIRQYRVEHDSFKDMMERTTGFNHNLGAQSTANTAVHIKPDAFAANRNAMNLSSSVNLFSQGKIVEIDLENDTSIQPVSVVQDATEDASTRWIIQTKFECPILNFKDVSLTVSSSAMTSGQTPRGMWHQYGRLPNNDEGIFLAIEDVPRTWIRNAENSGKAFAASIKSLAELCGFSQNPVKLGEVASGRIIREAVVAVPFIEIGGEKKFFELDERNVVNARNFLRAKDEENRGERKVAGVGNSETFEKSTSPSVIDMVRKARRYVFPPTMDFLNYPEVTPFSMYIFEFTHTLSQQDLSDIWQNLPPALGEAFEESEATVAHPLLANELMGFGDGNDKSPKGGEFPNKVRWMVFKVKQRANTNYFDKVVDKKGSPLSSQVTSKTQSALVDQDLISFNWPYDFFSLVELVKIDAEMTFSDLDTTSNITKNVSKGNPRKEKSSRTIDQNPRLGTNPRRRGGR